MKNLTTAIFAKCAIGTSLYTAIGGRIYKGRAPARAAYPYVVYLIVSNSPEKTFSENFENTIIQFSLFSSASGSTEVEDMYTYLNALYDECALTVTGSTWVWMKWANSILMLEEHATTLGGTIEVWHYAVDYDVKTQLA